MCVHVDVCVCVRVHNSGFCAAIYPSVGFSQSELHKQYSVRKALIVAAMSASS